MAYITLYLHFVLARSHSDLDSGNENLTSDCMLANWFSFKLNFLMNNFLKKLVIIFKIIHSLS